MKFQRVGIPLWYCAFTKMFKNVFCNILNSCYLRYSGINEGKRERKKSMQERRRSVARCSYRKTVLPQPISKWSTVQIWCAIRYLDPKECVNVENAKVSQGSTGRWVDYKAYDAPPSYPLSSKKRKCPDNAAELSTSRLALPFQLIWNRNVLCCKVQVQCSNIMLCPTKKKN